MSVCTKLLLCICLAMTSLATQAAEKKIDVEVIETADGFKLDFQNSECPSRPNNKGCIKGDYGSAHKLRWEMVGDGRQKWEFTGLRFSPDGEDWGAKALQGCTMIAFNLHPSSRQSGWANTAKITASGREMRIDNRNQDPCVTHYQLYARHRQTGKEITSDPRIDNRGGGPR